MVYITVHPIWCLVVQRTDSDSFWGFHDFSKCDLQTLPTPPLPWACSGEPRPSHSKLSRRKYLQCPPSSGLSHHLPTQIDGAQQSTVKAKQHALHRSKKQPDFSIFLEICWSQSLFAGTLRPNLPWSVYQSNLSANFVASTHPKNTSASWEHRPKISQINWMQIQWLRWEKNGTDHLYGSHIWIYDIYICFLCIFVYLVLVSNTIESRL